MLRMFRELKGSYRYIVLIFALLFGQAFCDLALPSYTSDIINVGVQQGGIPDSVPDQIRESSMNQLFLFMDGDQQQEVKEYYTLKDGVYTHKKLKEEERDSLNTIFGKSMLAVSSLQQPDTQNALAEKMQLPNGADVPEDNRTASGRGEKTDNGTNDRKTGWYAGIYRNPGSHPVSEK